jgi:hypothetical protein
MTLTQDESVLIGKLAKRLAVRERKIAREQDAKRIQLDLAGLNFIKFINFINFAEFPKQ